MTLFGLKILCKIIELLIRIEQLEKFKYGLSVGLSVRLDETIKLY